MKLLNKLGIKKKLLSLHDYNEKILIKRIEKYQKNSSIALISDAGSPLISDPGYNLVIDYINKKIEVTTIPGPSSIISALQLSGLPVNNFIFYGFVPKNKSAINTLIVEILATKFTSIFFISGKRIINFLSSLKDHNIMRQISVCKEMTKKNERVFRGVANEVIKEISSDINNLKGEFVVILNGSAKKSNKIIDAKTESEIKKLLKNFSLTEVVEIVHNLTNLSKKEIYKKTLLLKND